MLQNEYTKAIPLLQKDIKYSVRFEEYGNAVISLYQLALCYLELKEFEKSLQPFQEALQLYQKYEEYLVGAFGMGRFEKKIKIYKGLSRFYLEQKNFEKAYMYRNEADILEDSLAKFEYREQLIILEEKHSFEQKNQEQIRDLSQNQEHKPLQQKFKVIMHSIKKDLDLEADWDKFRMHFEQVNPSFFTYLSNNYPELSQNDLKICAYMKINLDNKQISTLLNSNADSIRVSKHRIRKKMNVSSEKDLYQIFSQIA